MSKILKIFLFGILIFLTFFFLYKPPLFKNNLLKIEEEIPSPNKLTDEAILNQLTLEQKVGQLLLIGFAAPTNVGASLAPEEREGKTLTPELENLIRKIQPGGVLLLSRNIENENQLKKIIEDLQKVSIKNTGLPLFVAVDQEGEPMSRIKFLREKTPQSKIKNIEQAYKVGFNRGKELRELGINLNLAPVLDITQPADFLYSRSFQKDSQKTGELAKALISGQKAAGTLTAIKHFPGYGGISFNPERVKLPILANIPEISQFKEALKANPEMIMTSNVIYNEIDKELSFALSPQSIQFLKTELNPVRNNISNKVLIISDDLSSPVLKREFSLENTVILAFQAGVDILIVAGFDEPEDPIYTFDFLFEAAKRGEISEARINQSVLKIIELKQNLLY